MDLGIAAAKWRLGVSPTLRPALGFEKTAAEGLLSGSGAATRAGWNTRRALGCIPSQKG